MKTKLDKNCELTIRMEKSFQRLHDKKYQLHIEDSRDSGGWPGDWEGRTLLGLIHLSKVLNQTPKYLNEILDFLFKVTREQGYFGAKVIKGEADEQQLSGNSWFLRAICELYQWTGDERALHTIKMMAENLLLPMLGKYNEYPNRPEQRVFEGKASGEKIDGMVNGWHTSSDIGCAYIMLDGATQAFEILKSNTVKQLSDGLEQLILEMIENYRKIDFLGISAQTHATLSGARGILRYASLIKDEKLYDFVEEIFELYKNYGMTENFANYNWFKRPLWTEPCAYVDSFMVAMQLFQKTQKRAYLELAHYIYYNAFGFGQRSNGGFGCDNCVGSESVILMPQKDSYEAFWCCTMRGADGLTTVADDAVFEDNGKLYINFFFSGEYTLADGSIIFIESEYPVIGKTRIKYIGQNEKTVILYIPSWAENVTITKNGDETDNEITLSNNDIIQYNFDILLRKEDTIGEESIQDVYKFMRGPLILGIDSEIDAEKFSHDMLEPINFNYIISEEESRNRKTQILFHK